MTTKNDYVLIDDDPWLSGPQVDEYLKISHQTRWRWERSGKLRPGVRMSSSAKRWKKSWIDDLMEGFQTGAEV